MRHFTLLAFAALALVSSGCVGPGLYPPLGGPLGGPMHHGYPGAVGYAGMPPAMVGMGPMQRLRMRMFQRDLAILQRRYPILSATLGIGGSCACAPMMDCCDPCGGIMMTSMSVDCGCGSPMISTCGAPSFDMGMSYGCGAPTCGAPSCGFPSCGAPMPAGCAAPSCGFPSYGPPMEPSQSFTPTVAPHPPLDQSQYLTPAQPYSMNRQAPQQFPQQTIAPVSHQIPQASAPPLPAHNGQYPVQQYPAQQGAWNNTVAF